MDFDDVAPDSLISPRQLKRFLGVNRWGIVEDHENEWEVWRAPEDVSSPTVTLLFDQEYVDYESRLFEANEMVRRAYHLDAVGLSERITSLSADLFFVRIDQFSRDGTISFKQAQRALDSISIMVKAAATTTSNPNHSHKGRRPAEVEEFISDNLRLGHTKKGSFIVTAVARFDDEPAESVDNNASGVEAADHPDLTDHSVNTVEIQRSDDDPTMPFGRRVMRTLSRGLDAARKVASDQQAIGTAVEDGLSLELAEALQRISDEQGLQTIDVTFDWSPSVPQPSDVPDKIIFEQEQIRELPAITERLQVHDGPRQIEMIGSVITLSRSLRNGAPEDSGPVTILGEVEGGLRKVVVELAGEEHRWAILAYQSHLPVIVSGALVKRGSWRLEGPVRLDVEAIRQLSTTLRSKSREADSRREPRPPTTKGDEPRALPSGEGASDDVESEELEADPPIGD